MFRNVALALLGREPRKQVGLEFPPVKWEHGRFQNQKKAGSRIYKFVDLTMEILLWYNVYVMAREREPTPKKTFYEVIEDLYEIPSDQSKASRISVEGDVKTFVLEGESSIRIERLVDRSKPWFMVIIGNILGYRIDQKEGFVMGSIESLRIPFSLQIGGFIKQEELGESITIPIEHREEVGGILVDWTRKSIEEGKLGNPPFKLNFPLPKK